MLIKHLNDLANAIGAADDKPSAEQFMLCAKHVSDMRHYLDGQQAAFRQRGYELLNDMLPEDYASRIESNSAMAHEFNLAQ